MKAGGSFPALNDSFLSPECAQEISDYFASDDGQYFVDVARVTERARRHFEDLSDSDPPSSKKVIVFDIDETTLSNAAEWQKAFLNRIGHRRGWTWRLRLQFPMLLGDLLLEKAPLGASDRPPLAPMLGLYHYLYSSGYRQGILYFNSQTTVFSLSKLSTTIGCLCCCHHRSQSSSLAPSPALASALG